MMKPRQSLSIAVVALGATLLASDDALAGPAPGETFNGGANNQISTFGFYYAVPGGLFPTGPTPNGSNNSTPLGGTFRFITDDPSRGLPLDAWQKDDFPAQDSSLALTLKNGASIVYDNNGIETGTFPAGFYGIGGPGHAFSYSMSNNFDLIYAGYFQLTQATTISQMIAYFAGDGTGSNPFQFNSPAIAYRMNIWSNINGDLQPVNTGSFAGDVFTSDMTPGTFSVSDTGVPLTFSSRPNSEIFRLTDTLNSPITLQPGIYWFSSDAIILAPEPTSFILCGMGLIGVAGYGWRRKRRATA